MSQSGCDVGGDVSSSRQGGGDEKEERTSFTTLQASRGSIVSRETLTCRDGGPKSG